MTEMGWRKIIPTSHFRISKEKQSWEDCHEESVCSEGGRVYEVRV